MKNQEGLVMVFALLVLMSMTLVGVASVSSGILQTRMAASLERKSIAFDAAEAALAGVVFESEDRALLSDPANKDPLSEARQKKALNPTDTTDTLSCYDNERTERFVTSDGLKRDTMHTAKGDFRANPKVSSWSKSAFVREESCRGSSNTIGRGNLSCHLFKVRGCGQIHGSTYSVANTMSATVLAPATN